MKDEQIKGLLTLTKQRVILGVLALPCIGWTAVAAFALAFWSVGFAGLGLFLGGILTLPAIQASREGVLRWRRFQSAPALELWRGLTDNARFLPSISHETSKLSTSLRSLYDTDGHGEVLPIVQAARLLVIYDLQQQRRTTIIQRVIQLRMVREQLVDKAARLKQLGDSNISISAGTEEMKLEIAALERLGDDILASCHRLEAIVLSAHRAVQVKQLHREISQLKLSVSPEKDGSLQLVAPEITDIERQIGREIETFLQLERETDAHLRDI